MLDGCLLEEVESKAKPMFVVTDKRVIEDERARRRVSSLGAGRDERGVQTGQGLALATAV